MSGSVWEWTADTVGDGAVIPFLGMRDIVLSSIRGVRGGSRLSEPVEVRVANRNWIPNSNRWGELGLRLVRTTP